MFKEHQASNRNSSSTAPSTRYHSTLQRNTGADTPATQIKPVTISSARGANPPVSIARILGHRNSSNTSNKLQRNTARSSSPWISFRPEFTSEHFKGNIENYSTGKALGQGAYATVRQGVNKATGALVAIKTYEKARLLDPRKKRNVMREAEIMAVLDHPNIVKYVEGCETQRQVHLVMEHGGSMSLHCFLKQKISRKVSESEAKRLFRQIVEVIGYCHDKEVAHRDIKLQNILLDSKNNIKLIDFGFSAYKNLDEKIRTFCGTPSYMSPQIVNKTDFTPIPADIWALGVLLFALLTGTFPFKGHDEKDLYRKISRGAFEMPQKLPKSVRTLIHKMLSHDPSKRPSCAEILEDPWFTQETPKPPRHEARQNSAPRFTYNQKASEVDKRCQMLYTRLGLRWKYSNKLEARCNSTVRGCIVQLQQIIIKWLCLLISFQSS